MKKILFMTLAAVAMMTSCSKEEMATTTSDNKNLKLSINFASMKTRAMEPSADGYKPTTVYLELCDASNVPLTYKGRTLTSFDVANAGNNDYILHNIPAATTKIKVYVNKEGQAANTSINDLQTLAKVPYFGESDIQVSPDIDPLDGNVIWKANVDVKINLSRFEVKGHNGTTESTIKVTKPDDATVDYAGAVSVWGNTEVDAAKARALAALKVVKPELVEGEVSYTYELTYTNGTDRFAVSSVEEVYMNSFLLTSSGAVEFNDNDGQGLGNWNTVSATNYTAAHSNMWNAWAPTAINKVAGFNLYPQKISKTDEQMKAKENGMPHVILKLKMADNTTRYVTIRQFRNGGDIVKEIEAAKAYQFDLKDVSLGLYEKKLTVKASWGGETIPDPEEPEEPVDPTDPDPEDETDGRDLLVVAITIEDWTIVPVAPVL